MIQSRFRTSVNHSHNSPRRTEPTTLATQKKVESTSGTPRKSEEDKNSNLSKRQERKSKRIEGRRHFTIGYTGEIRSPLKETQANIVATVQRSKSAQTPMMKKPSRKSGSAKHTLETEFDVSHAMVTRSYSIRSPVVRESHGKQYTPLSQRVKRHQSDRITGNTPTAKRKPILKMHYDRRIPAGNGTTPLRLHEDYRKVHLTRASPRLWIAFFSCTYITQCRRSDPLLVTEWILRTKNTLLHFFFSHWWQSQKSWAKASTKGIIKSSSKVGSEVVAAPGADSAGSKRGVESPILIEGVH